jgi:hypothetical protein
MTSEDHMPRLFWLGCLITILLSTFTLTRVSGISPTATAQPTEAATAGTPPAEDCPVTAPIYAQPAKDPNADSFGFGYWYVNADRTIWAGPLPDGKSWEAGSQKVAWIRPKGEDLTISGHRLNVEKPHLHAEIPCCYLTGFQVTGLIFPTEGCWEVLAKAGKNELRFITYVMPYSPTVPAQRCDSLANAVKSSDAIIVGKVSAVEDDDPYAWDTLDKISTWKLPPGWNGVGDWFSLLQDLRTEPKLDASKTYVLFMQYDPWRLVCAQGTTLEVNGDQLRPIGRSPLWHPSQVAPLKQEIAQLTSQGRSTLNGR